MDACETQEGKTISVVSTFPNAHFCLYGEDFIIGCVEFGIPLTLVCYDPLYVNESIRQLKAWPGGIDEDPEVWEWHRQVAHMPRTANYRYQAARFAWKVFAMTMPQLQEGVDWLVWLDADVEVVAKPDWDAVLKEDADVCYLGRPNWDHSETGFLAWNMRGRGAEALRELRRTYISGEVFLEKQWHDAWLFDRVRERMDLVGHNLSPTCYGLDAWDVSPLAKWSVHHKGNRKFIGKTGT